MNTKPVEFQNFTLKISTVICKSFIHLSRLTFKNYLSHKYKLCTNIAFNKSTTVVQNVIL